jgi:type III restriction enzyme
MVFVRASKVENDDLQRLAVRMATGTGKTNVMALVIAWMTLNHIDNPQGRYSLNFLVIAPGITIRDRLQCCCGPEHPNNAYEAFDLVPQDLRKDLLSRPASR